MKTSIALLIMLALAPIGGYAFAQESAGVEQALRDLNQSWANLYNQGDFEGFADLYADDFLLRHSTGLTNENMEELRAWWQGARERGLATFEIEVMEAGPLGENYAYSLAEWSALNEDGQVAARGEAMLVARLDQGTWKIFRHFSGVIPEPTD